jgi:hypothetical protein
VRRRKNTWLRDRFGWIRVGWIIAFYCILAGLVCGPIVFGLARSLEDVKVMSPCQCRLAGGCGVTWECRP